MIFEDIDILFDLAIRAGKLDDLATLYPIMEELENRDGVLLIRAYDRFMKKDMKDGLALVNRAVSAGYPPEKAMLLTAAYLNLAGFPKRAVGIGEKLLKNQALSPHEIIPVLSAAYRLQGREKEAEELELQGKKGKGVSIYE